MRLLTNLETNQRKLLRFILLGQPELRELLGTYALRQLDQRITARYHLGPLSEAETSGYLSHRMRVAGGDPAVFTRGARRAIHALSGGVPRLINVLADRALLGAYVGDSRSVSAAVVRRAAAEVLDRELPSSRRPMLAALAAAMALIAVALWWFLPGDALRARLPGSAGTVPELATSMAVPVPAPDPSAPAPADQPLPAPPGAASQAPPAAPTGPDAGPPRVALAHIAAPPWQPPAQGSLESALEAVYAAWSADVQPPTCENAPRVGLMCIDLVGSWLTVASFNRPATLNLRLANGQLIHAALLALDDTEAEIEVDGQRRVLPRTQLDRYWTGQFTALWEAPTQRLQLATGMRGPDVAELRRRLARLGYPSSANLPDSPEYDSLVERAVREFQADEGLAADGIAGAFTWVRLADRLGSDAPRLAPARVAVAES